MSDASAHELLSNFALALAEGVDMGPLLARTVGDLGRLLELDRISLFLRDEGSGARPPAITIRAGWARDGVPPVPSRLATLDLSIVPEPALRGRPVAGEVATELAELEGAREALRLLGTDSILVVPVMVDGEFWGAVTASTVGRRHAWSQAEIALVESAARHLAAGLKQAALVRDVERQRDRMKLLAEMSAAVQRGRSVADVLEAAERGLRETLALAYGGIGLLSPDGSTLEIVKSFGRRLGPFRAGSRLDLRTTSSGGPRLLAQVLAGPTPVVVRDLAEYPGLAETRELIDGIGVTSLALFPMQTSGEAVGILSVGTDERGLPLSADEIAMLQSLADIASVAIVQRRAAEASERAARDAHGLARELEGRARVAETVSAATQFLNFRLNDPGLLSAFAAEVVRVLPSADGCVVYVADADGTELTVAAAHGSGRATQVAFEDAMVDPSALRCAGAAWLQGRPVSLDVSGLDELMEGSDAATRARIRASVEPHDVRHLLAAPIRAGDRRLGVLEALGCREEGFGPEDREVLAVLAEQSAIALRNARLIEELRASNRLKDDFLATLSHEVRTPLTGIIGWTEVLLEGAGQDAEGQRALEAILSQATLLNRMIGDLIDLSRIENLGLEVRRLPVDATDVVDAALESVTPVARKKGVELRREVQGGLPRIDGDAGRLKQVLWNLLSNAVKFSPAGTEVVVSARRSAEGVVLAVADRGAGIEPAFLPHVFERFRQEESGAGRSFGGLGLGLAIAKAIVDAHGGRISVESEGRGRGSVFTVRLPIRGSGVHPRMLA